jgi:hypothetical protein
MVAHNRVRCTVVAVPIGAELGMSCGAMARDLLPWADPYVAQLIKKLQEEVRRERRQLSVRRRRRSIDFFSPPACHASQFGGQEE